MIKFEDTDPVEIDCGRCRGSGIVAADWCSACGGCGSDWFDRSALHTLAHNISACAALAVGESRFLLTPPRPRHKHDCDACEFLGFVDGVDPFDRATSWEWDLWFCPRCDGGSLIARYGSDGPNYTSSPIALLRRSLEERCMPHPALTWALMLLDNRER